MKKLGFGCLRLPMAGGEVDQAQFNRMVDRFMKAGFCYFDTAHTYIGGKSEAAIREGLVKRYPRQDFMLANKLTTPLFKSREDIIPGVSKRRVKRSQREKKGQQPPDDGRDNDFSVHQSGYRRERKQ